MKNLLIYLKDFEPAVWKTLVAAIVGIALVWGFDISALGDQIGLSLDLLDVAIPAILTIASGFWIRKSVTAPGNSEVVLDKNGNTVAGPASAAPNGTPVDVYEFPDEHEPRHMVG